MKRLIMLLGLFGLLVALVLPTIAQVDVPDWTIWFLENGGTISEVNLNNEVLNTITLPVASD